MDKGSRAVQGDVVGSVTSRGLDRQQRPRGLCDGADPDAALDVNSPDRRRKGASYIEGDEAYMRVFKNVGAEKGQGVELTVRKNVLFKQKDITGLCDSLSYASKRISLFFRARTRTKRRSTARNFKALSARRSPSSRARPTSSTRKGERGINDAQRLNELSAAERKNAALLLCAQASIRAPG